MIHLLAYLMVRGRDGGWSVRSHRNLDGLIADWKVAVTLDDKTSGVVHVGFWRPDASSFDSVCAKNEGRILLTGSARLALPRAFSSAGRPCATVGALPVYLALTGWGYEIEEPPMERLPSDLAPVRTLEVMVETPIAPSDWLQRLQHESPGLFAECLTLSIMSEGQYQQKECLLPADVRDELGAYRFKSLTGFPPTRDIMIDGLMFSPPWLLKLPLSVLDLTVRAANCLGYEGAKSVGDIAAIGSAGLMRLPNLGRKTVSDISAAIFQAFKQGSAFCDAHGFERQPLPEIPRADFPWILKGSQQNTQPDSQQARLAELPASRSFGEAIHAALDLVTERHKRVLMQRMGFKGSKRTLEEIAKSENVTRERIRQIERKAVIAIINQMPIWEERFKTSLEKLLTERQSPLPLVGLEVLDQWFVGADKLEGPFQFALQHFVEERKIDVISVAGQRYVSMLSQDEWSEAEKASRALLSTLSKEEMAPSESEVRVLIESQLVGPGEELRPLLWETATRWAHFSDGPIGERFLVSYGMGAESLVEVILSESETSLHYSEIAKRCASKGRTFDHRRVRNAAQNVGYLLGRGVFGLRKHINLSSDEQSEILAEVEDMLSGTPGRQWHAAEIVDELEVRAFDFDGRLSKYDLHVILESSTVLAYLGRMVWTSGSKEVLGSADRYNIWQAVVALLEKNGSPMFASEIRENISKDRGLSRTFQIHQADPVIRVGQNQWGILWRDIPFNATKAREIIERIVDRLNRRGSGIHNDEIAGALKDDGDFGCMGDPIMLISLAIRSGRVKHGRGGYLYLPEWEGPRRLTVSEAIEAAFDSFGEGVLAVDVSKKASELLGREISNNTVANVLAKIATYDSLKGLWCRAEEDDVSDVDESA